LLAVSLLLPWAASPAAAPGTLLELGPVEVTPVRDLDRQYLAEIQRDLGARFAKFKDLPPMTVFLQLIKEHLVNAVPSRKVRYASVDESGRERIYSGRVFLPSRKAADPPREVPLVLYQHGTEVKRGAVPFNREGEETVFGALAAELCGFAVAMPDGDGMGADPSPRMHAYCSAETTARCALDMIRAVRGELGDKRIFDDVNYIWDGETYLVGYSEGGYITMAMLKELATHPALADIRLNGAACMGAPLDLARMVRALVAEKTAPYSRPYIPAYLLAAWHELHPAEVSFAQAVNPALLKRDATGNVEDWLQGRLGGAEISALIQARLTGNQAELVPPRRVLTEAWIRDAVETPSSGLNRLLEANSLVGGWKPAVPVLLAHDPFDETVPSSGTQAIFDDWTRQKANPIGIIRLAAGSTGSGHVGGALLAIPSAFVWIAADMPRSLMAMAKDRLRNAIIAAAPPELEANLDVMATGLGLQDANANRALLPLSRIDPAAPGAPPYTLSYGDRFFKVGKVKLYVLERAPVFTGQRPTPGLGGYTRLVKEMKNLDDSFKMLPNVPYYLSVYPEKGGVALTLKFVGKPGTFTANIKQLKNKIIGRNTGALFTLSPNFKSRVQTDQFDRAESGKPFITLP
jgi:pimeloyl-ACP methyl ester carboxylesterase